MAKASDGWMRLEIEPELERIARDRCAGYQFDSDKSMAEIMRDCWIQGFLDGAGSMGDQAKERAEGGTSDA